MSIFDDSGITRDPALFPDPEAFRPERFLDTQNPRLVEFDLPFGFGRRICPGMHVASQSLFIVIARFVLFLSSQLEVPQYLGDKH